MAIGLFAAFLFAGTNYIQIDPYIIKSNEGIIENNAMMLSSQFITYENLKGYSLPKNNWQNEIYAINRFTPKSLDGTTWSYSNDSGYYFCMSGSIDKNKYLAFKNVETKFSGKVYVNTTCGQLTSLNYSGTFPATLAITVWIRN